MHTTCLDLTLDIKYTTITLFWLDINVVWYFYGSWIVTYMNERIINHIRNERFLCRYFCVCVETDRWGLVWAINYAAISVRLEVFGGVGVANWGPFGTPLGRSYLSGVFGSCPDVSSSSSGATRDEVWNAQGSFVTIYGHGFSVVALDWWVLHAYK